MLFDGAGPSEGKIKAMVDQSQVDWDLCDVDGYVAVRLANAGALSIIDYKKVKRDQVMEPFALEHAIAGYTYSFVLAYNAAAYPERPPLSWKDFFDRRTFPGRRAVWRWMIGGFEAAAMAAGAPRDQVYPIDIEAAVAKLATLGDDLTVWESGDHVRQMLLDGSINMACMWHSRAAQLGAESEGKVAWTFEEGLLCPGMWVVPKKNPGGNAAFDFSKTNQTSRLQNHQLRGRQSRRRPGPRPDLRRTQGRSGHGVLQRLRGDAPGSVGRRRPGGAGPPARRLHRRAAGQRDLSHRATDFE